MEITVYERSRMKIEKCKRVYDMKRICGKPEYTLPQGKENEYMLFLRFVVSGKQNFNNENLYFYITTLLQLRI